MKATDHIKRAAFEKAVDYFLADPEHNIVKIMDLIDKVAPKDLFASQRTAFRGAIDDQSNWYRLIMHIMNDTNPEVRDDLVKTLIIDGSLMAWPVQEANRDKYECNIPWAILLDPTSACNLHCTGCWAAEYGNKLNLSLEEIDSIIKQGKELGTHVYIYTGGEPLVRKKDLIKLCEMHPDCVFLSFTNGTLIDEAFCRDMIRVKNFVPAISAEGFEEATDSRRGAGTYAKVQKAMQLLKQNGLPFGVSCCYTSQNAESIASEEYFDYLIDQGALFAWIFSFMPVGAGSTPDLMASPEQREHLYRFVREMRQKKPLFTLDFQNDGEFVGGCIAGGRRRPVRFRALLQCQYSRGLPARGAAVAHFYGVLPRAAFQRQSAPSMSHPGKQWQADRNGRARRCSFFRSSRAGNRRRAVRENQGCRCSMETGFRAHLE